MQKNYYWRDLIQRQKDSGMTVEEFCKGENISSAHFYKKKRELDTVEDNRDLSFIPVQIEEDTVNKPGNSRTIEFSIDGHSIICKGNDIALIIGAFK